VRAILSNLQHDVPRFIIPTPRPPRRLGSTELAIAWGNSRGFTGAGGASVGVFEFGTELVAGADKSLVALLGASPGASDKPL